MFEVYRIYDNGDNYCIYSNSDVKKVKKFLLQGLDPSWKIKIKENDVFLIGGRNALDFKT